jgi:ankyrin repeat protein
VRFLLDNGATIGPYTLQGTSRANGTIDTMELLSSRGAQLHDSGALQNATLENRLENVKFLLDKGARIDEIPENTPTDDRDCDNGAALHRAVSMSAIDVVELLLARGASIHILDQMGRTPMMIAEKRKEEEEMKKIIKLLKQSETKL